MISAVLTLLVIGLVSSSTDAVSLTCGNTLQQTEVNCTCSNSGGQGVEWFVNGIFLSTCFNTALCIQQPIGYTFSMNSSADLYFLTINSHSYSKCGEYECRDVKTATNKDTVTVSISSTYVDMTWEPEEQIQPSNHSDGNFSVTSPCLFDVNEDTTKVQWYTLSKVSSMSQEDAAHTFHRKNEKNGKKEIYFPKKRSTNYMTTSCQACKGVTATQIQTSFLHEERNQGDQNSKEVSFVVEIYDISISFPGVYFISDQENIQLKKE